MKRGFGSACLVLASAGLLSVSAGEAAACRLALLLALDVSASVDQREYRLQRDGLAAALAAPEVSAAFLSNSAPVALSVFEWSGRHNQATVLDWRLIRSQQDLLRAARDVAAARRSASEFPTALGHAMAHAALSFRRAPPCFARTIDVSGDGENNDGYRPLSAYRHFSFDGAQVNALAIGGSAGLPDLVAYYRAELIRGPGAFVEVAADYADFERAMRRKLEREVSSLAIGAVEARP